MIPVADVTCVFAALQFHVHVGSFETEEEAVKAWDNYAWHVDPGREDLKYPELVPTQYDTPVSINYATRVVRMRSVLRAICVARALQVCVRCCGGILYTYITCIIITCMRAAREAHVGYV